MQELTVPIINLHITGFPVILAQFPKTPQFRPPAWFCVAVGVALLLLQLALFHGESAWHCQKIQHQIKKPLLKREQKHATVCQVVVSSHSVVLLLVL